jgi:hypothetical protein
MDLRAIGELLCFRQRPYIIKNQVTCSMPPFRCRHHHGLSAPLPTPLQHPSLRCPSVCSLHHTVSESASARQAPTTDQELPSSSSSYLTVEEVKAVAAARGLHLDLKNLGPFYRITCRDGTFGSQGKYVGPPTNIHPTFGAAT